MKWGVGLGMNDVRKMMEDGRNFTLIADSFHLVLLSVSIFT